MTTTVATNDHVGGEHDDHDAPAPGSAHGHPRGEREGVGFRAPFDSDVQPGARHFAPHDLARHAGPIGPVQATASLFKPSGYWELGTTYRVSIPVGAGTSPSASTVVRFTTTVPSVLALQQYLAMLGYLPLRFTPNGDIPNRKVVLGARFRPTPACYLWSR